MDGRRLGAALLLAIVAAGGPHAHAEEKGKPPAPAPAPAPAGDPKAALPARINQAIDAGVRWLMDRDRKEKSLVMASGNWEDEITGNRVYEKEGADNVWCHPTGCTSLALYAALKSGVPKDDPAVKKAFLWLKTGKANCLHKGNLMLPNLVPNGTYEISALVLALEAKANPHKKDAERERELKFRLKKGEKLEAGVKLEPGDHAWMKLLLEALVKRQHKGAAWRYGHATPDGPFYEGVRGDNDLSASQLAMLALLAGERCGFKQPDQLYLDALQWTLGNQEREGPERTRWDPSIRDEDKRYGLPKDHARGFGYTGISGKDDENRATGSMTCCGLANLVICSGILEARDAKGYTPALREQVEKSWWDAVAWMDLHWSVEVNVNRKGYPYHYYYLYCMERACDLKRINLLAGHPWYAEGARILVDQQSPSGAWIRKNDTHEPNDVLDTCFALLFLNRATPAITAGD